MKIKVVQDILAANDQIARGNQTLLTEKKIFALNLMSSPGAGKTSLILETIKRLKGKLKIAVIEGDVASQVDAEKINKETVSTVQINTGYGGCHLEANMVSRGLASLPLDNIELLFIENVGNLICPAEFKLGEHKRILITSLPEGDDKPYKYPELFIQADAIVINKFDLLPYLDFNVKSFFEAVKGFNPDVKIFKTSCRTGEGIDGWIEWLLEQRQLLMLP